MKTIEVTRQIKAPLNKVFLVISDSRNFANAVPQITQVEFLTAQQMGVGTRFRETRVTEGGKEATAELEVTEYVENERIRLVSDAGGTLWDTVFTVRALSAEPSDGVALNMVMTAKPHALIARILNPLVRGKIIDLLEDDMDAVKAFCEKAD